MIGSREFTIENVIGSFWKSLGGGRGWLCRLPWYLIISWSITCSSGRAVQNPIHGFNSLNESLRPGISLLELKVERFVVASPPDLQDGKFSFLIHALTHAYAFYLQTCSQHAIASLFSPLINILNVTAIPLPTPHVFFLYVSPNVLRLISPRFLESEI